jgi:CheY-like chemotaxis protein
VHPWVASAEHGVRLHEAVGGHFNIYSEFGVGTTFRLYLPGAQNEASPDAGSIPEGSMSGGGETVLVVEDNPALLRVAVMQLTGLGYRVRESENVAAAIAILEGNERIDLVFADVVMPGKLDGYHLARTVRERWPATKILMTSGFPGGKPDHAATVAADLPLLTKPYRRDALARALHEALGTARDGQPRSAQE